MAGRTFNLGDFQAGIQNARSPFALPMTALADGENVELYRGLRTRKGYGVIATGVGGAGALADAIGPGHKLYIPFNGSDESCSISDYFGHTCTMRMADGELRDCEDSYEYWIDTSHPYGGGASLQAQHGSPAELDHHIRVDASSDWDLTQSDWTIRAYVRMGSGGGQIVTLLLQNATGHGWTGVANWAFECYAGGFVFRHSGPNPVYLDAPCAITEDTWWKVECRYEAATSTYRIAADPAASWSGAGTTRGTITGDPPPYTAEQPLEVCRVSYPNDNGMWIDDLQLIVGSDPPLDVDGNAVGNEVVNLQQVRFPTTEKSYLIAQVRGIDASNTLSVCADTLPAESLTFSTLRNLGANAGIVSIGVLGDRAIITEGIEEQPFVFSGGLDGPSAPGDWPHPYEVLVRPFADEAYSISREVLDKDEDQNFQIGGVSSVGDLLIFCEVPRVKAFHFELQTANEGGGSGTSITSAVQFDTSAHVEFEDLKGAIVNWVQDNGPAGHFEGQDYTLDIAAAVDKGGGLVGLPITGQPFSAGDSIQVRGTTNYDGTYAVDASSSTDEIVVSATYSAETFTGTETVSQRLTLGPGNDCPLVEAGLKVTIEGVACTISSITGDGEADGEVTLSGSMGDSPVSSIVGLSVVSQHEDVKGPAVNWVQDNEASGHFEGAQQYLDNASAVNKGAGLVGIPCTAHGYDAGQTIELRGTSYYDGSYVLDATTSVNEMVIEASYLSETFSGSETVNLRCTLGADSDCPDVEEGCRVILSGVERIILSVIDNGEGTGEVILDSAQADDAIESICHVKSSSAGVGTYSANESAVSVLAEALETGHTAAGGYGDMSIRQVIDAAYLADTSANMLRLKLAFPFADFCATSDDEPVLDHLAIGIQDAGPDTVATPTELTFNDGESGLTLPNLNSFKWTDWVPFTYDGASNLVIVYDFGPTFTEGYY